MSELIRKRSVIISGHRTSVSLEPEFWTAVCDIARQRDLSINELVTEIDRGRRGNLSSALRVHVLIWAQGRKDEPNPKPEEDAAPGRDDAYVDSPAD